MSEKRKKLLSGLTAQFDDALSCSSSARASHIELIENREAVVEGCRNIVEYNDTAIKLNMGARLLRVSGRGLTIRTLRPEQIIICGDIATLDFCN